MNQPKKGDLRVWWIPQVPMRSFHVPVKTIKEAKLVLDTLARYDKFQLDNNIKPDYCNTGGLEQFDPVDIDLNEGWDGWTEWNNEDGQDIDDLMKAIEA